MKTAYDKLKSEEKVNIDRRVDDMVKDIERHNESKNKSAWDRVRAATKDVSSYVYGYVLNGGHLNVPETRFLDDGSEIRCATCNRVFGAVYRKKNMWYCDCCKDDIPGAVEDEFLNYKKGA